MALNSFTDTYQNVLGSRGRSFRSVFYQRAKEERMRKKLGLITPEERQQQISAAQTQQANATQATTPQSEEQRQAGTGEMMGLSTLQFNRNRKAILKTIEDLASGSLSETQARVFLSSIGMNPDSVEALIEDASDGSVDTPIAEEATNEQG